MNNKQLTTTPAIEGDFISADDWSEDQFNKPVKITIHSSPVLYVMGEQSIESHSSPFERA